MFVGQGIAVWLVKTDLLVSCFSVMRGASKLWFVSFEDLSSIKLDRFAWFVGYVKDLHKLFSFCPTHRVYYVC